MRKPSLALVVATVNRAPPDVTASTIGYSFGLSVTLLASTQWRQRQ